MRRLILLIIGLLNAGLIFADNVKNIPQTIIQPNGKVIHCLGSGDEYYHRLHDANGYTIVMNPVDGYFYYGIISGDKVVPSKYVAGTVNPANVGLDNEAKISDHLYAELRNNHNAHLKSTNQTQTTGIVNSLCIYISFADDSVFTYNRGHFKQLWSATDHSSVRDFFNEISYNTLDLEVSHFPASPDSITVSYKDIFPRNYYLPKSAANPGGYDGDVAEREHGMLKRAVEFVQNQIPANLNVDMNNDGILDNVCFVIRGQSSAWSDLLWPHEWGLFTYDVRINGAKISNYILTMEEGFGTGTLCHEIAHAFGAPDLYHYSSTKTGPDAVGTWCLMCGSADPPQGICGFLKYKYNHWIDTLPEITKSGVYSLKPLSEAKNNLFKIKSPFSKDEYFVLEYRKKSGRYDSSVPGTGLLVYRINQTAGNGNAGGPPDEVYIYRPGGSMTAEGSINLAAMSAPGINAINDNTDPFCFLYHSGEGSKGGLNLSDISIAGDSIRFEVTIPNLFTPVNLCYNPGSGTVDLYWTAIVSPDLKGYHVYRDGILYASTTQNSFCDTKVFDKVTYDYSVSAFYEGQNKGESGQSNKVIYTPTCVKLLPYKENFELPGHGWIIKDNVDGFRWGDDNDLGMETTNPSKFIGVNSIAAGYGTVCSDFAITPRLNLFGKTKVFAHFDYAFKSWQQHDSLKIFYRTARTSPWVKIIDMETCGTSALYVWNRFNIEIPAESYTSEAQLGFEYSDGDDGNSTGFGAAIDNVVIDEVATSGINENQVGLAINMYPNPAKDETTLNISGNNSGEATLKLITADGRAIWSDIRHNFTSGQEKISLRGLSAGVYYLVVETGNEVTVRSLIKQN